jgi:acyl-CoA synthetase (AMP-forming)/AMP-acid ligase II
VLDELCVKPKVPVPFLRLNDLLEHHARRRPDAAAILAPGRAPLSYGRLYQHIGEVGRALRAMGIGREDRLAVTLPNGPEMAAAVLCVASNAACAVLNPAYAPDEFERYFDALQLHALITPAGIDSPARRVALTRGLRVIELAAAANAEAGLFTLSTNYGGTPSRDPVGPGSIALFVLTSGTTARPKIVPLTHANICTSAYSSVTGLALTECDRCLNVLPLFHCHGLIDTVLASLAAGAGVVCTAGCDVNSFFGWLRDFRVKWYSAVPTMHQAILAQARRSPEQAENCRLRLVRSASAPLPPRVFAELERTLATTVIEIYGMTETAGAPIAGNPLPPRQRKPGSVGLPVGLNVAIMSDDGNMLPLGQTGQVVIRGASVTSGYDGDPTATQDAFAGDWFKTGDLGFFDDDGYLFLVGRSREMINRGGEKITPREVDDVLLEHPAVEEAVTFAVPHTTLGEDVAAAIVLRPHAVATPKDIRQFVSGRLANFKVPRQVLIVKELQKGPTGKIRRVGLAAKLGLESGIVAKQSFVAPRTPLENELAGIWADVLQREQVGIYDDFFALGGDSLLAAQVLTCIHDKMHLEVSLASVFEAPTVVEMAHHLEVLIQTGRRPASDIVRIARDKELPASPAQERLWKLQHALPDLPYFNILYALRLTSPVDQSILERSLNEIVHRHEILRTTFADVEGRQVQFVTLHLSVPLIFDDLRKLPQSRKQTTGHHIIQEELLHSFDLTRGPLVRTRLVRLAQEEHLLLIAMHQIIVDGWSLGVVANELATLYETFAAGCDSALPPLKIQYADFASWQRQWRSHPDVAAQLTYWREQLRGPLPMVTFGKARPGRKADTHQTAQCEIALPPSLAQALRRFSHHDGGTLFMALVAGLKTLLHRHFSEDDLRVATNVANRNRADTEGLVGPIVNTVILRTNLGGDPTPREVLRRVRATTLAAYANQDLPFEELADALEQERSFEPAKLAQVMILLHNATLRPVVGSGRALAFEEANPGMPQPLVTTTIFDVILVLRESPDGLVGSCIYKPHLFSTTSIERLLRNFRKVLGQMVRQPEQPISTIPISVKSKR